MNQDTMEKMEKILDEKMRAQTEELKKYIDSRSSEIEEVVEESESRMTEELCRQKQRD